jgi:hypothetical protein
MKPIKVNIADPIYLPTEESGDDESTVAQVFPVLLSGAPPVSRRRFVVCAHFPFLDQSRRESVISQLRAGGASAACDFIVHDVEGEVTIITEVGEDGAAAYEAAAAVAVVKASCGWDESNPINVRVNDTALSVVARHDGDQWTANVLEAGR